MLKSDLVERLAQKFDFISVQNIAEHVNFLVELMSQTLSQRGRIEVRKFGSFSVHYLPPRNAHNPKTGIRLIAKAKYRPWFKAGKELRQRLNTTLITPPNNQ